MSENSNFRFDVSVSESGYASKPTSVDYQRMVFRPVNVNMVEFMDLICKGHSFCHIYKGNHRSNANFMYTHIICIDVDKYHTPMKQFVDRLILKMPSMAYTTFSNGKDGTYSFRLIYCFNSQITYQYEQLYHTICCEIGLQDNHDNCGAVKAQLMNGNSLPNIETYMSGVVYSESDFSLHGLEAYMEATTPNKKDKARIRKHKQAKHYVQTYIENNINMCLDELSGSTREFLEKYGKAFTPVTESRLEYNDKGYCLLDDDYMQLYNRFAYIDGKYRIQRFKDGEMRRKRLFIDGCMIRAIKPEIGFVELLYNLVYRRHYYYDNKDGVLSNQLLVDKTEEILAVPQDELDMLPRSHHGVFKTDKLYCLREGKSRRAYSREVAKMINHQKIAEWYDPNMTLAANLDYAKSNGIKVGKSTLKTYCKENGIDTVPGRVPIEEWYDPALSAAQNYERAKQMEITVSRTSVFNYAKSLRSE